MQDIRILADFRRERGERRREVDDAHGRLVDDRLAGGPQDADVAHRAVGVQRHVHHELAGNALAARVILGHTLALVLLSLLPAWLGMGWIYLAGAALGGAYFVQKSVRLVREPGPKAAMANFFASLVQLSLLLFAAIADRLILG